MSIYNRLLPEPIGGEAKLPIHDFQAVFTLWATGAITAAQAQAEVLAKSGAALTPAEVTEAQALRDWLAAVTGANRALRYEHFLQCLAAADGKHAYALTGPALKTLIGVP